MASPWGCRVCLASAGAVNDLVHEGSYRRDAHKCVLESMWLREEAAGCESLGVLFM